jgi:23S rRNA-/tRNA-specific pseudouridylate synthase
MPESDPKEIAESLPLGRGVRLLAVNEDGLIGLEKPAGILSHPNRDRDVRRSLIRAGYNQDRECFEWTDEDGVERSAWLVNRLDSPTSGVLLVALDPELAREVKLRFSARRASKTYYALVRGTPASPMGLWSDVLSKEVSSGRIRVRSGKRVPAKTRYQLVKSYRAGFPLSLLRLMPLTGRTHQLRVQCRKHGVPIVGDQTYGSFSFNRDVSSETGVKRMLLHSAAVRVRYAFRGKMSSFEAESPIPDAFAKVSGYRLGLMDGAVRAAHGSR